MASSVIEQSSLSNPSEARVVHMDIRYTVDFDKRVLEGDVSYTVDVSVGTELRLDTNNLDIFAAAVAGAPVEFVLDAPIEPFGRALHIPLAGATAGSSVVVSVKFSTTAQSAALQWLTREQTAGVSEHFLRSSQITGGLDLLYVAISPHVQESATRTSSRSARRSMRDPCSLAKTRLLSR
jgi:aminopeptidase N